MTTVTFENATLIEAVKRADRVSPNKGEGFEKAAGFVLEVNPEAEWKFVIKATDLEVYYREEIDTIEASGPAVSWRVPSHLFSSFIRKLPIGSGKHVTLTVGKDNLLSISSGKFRAKIGVLGIEDYPAWEKFDDTLMSDLIPLGVRLGQVAWAADKHASDAILAAVRLDGQTIAATNKYRIALAPLTFSGANGDIVVPLAGLTMILKDTQETAVGVVGQKLALSPHKRIQILCNIFAEKYPPVNKVIKRDHPQKIVVNRRLITETISLVSSADKKNPYPQVEVFIGQEQIAFYSVEENGTTSAGDILDIPEQAEHDRFKFTINPNLLVDAISQAGGDEIVLHYDKSKPVGNVYIVGAEGYEAWIATIFKPKPAHEGV